MFPFVYSTAKTSIHETASGAQFSVFSTLMPVMIPTYGFCSVLRPRVEENVLIVGASLTCLRVLIAAPNPTMPCRAELLTAMYAALFMSDCLIISVSTVEGTPTTTCNTSYLLRLLLRLERN